MRQTLVMALTMAMALAQVAWASDMAYRNPQYGFQLRLPSTAWKQVSYPDGLVAFGVHHPKRQVAVQVRVESFERYESTVKGFHHLISTLPNLLQKARIWVGKTPEGNPISMVEVIEWNDQDRPMVVAVSHTRLLTRNTTIVTTFQGELSVKSGKQLNRSEINEEEAEATAICRSVDTL